jgi:hypothetical protein
MAEPEIDSSEGAIKLTVNVSTEAIRALEEIARFYGENVTLALHRCIAVTYEQFQRSQRSQSEPSVKSRKMR